MSWELAFFCGWAFGRCSGLSGKGVLAEIEGRIDAEPVNVPAKPDPEMDRYLPVTADGDLVGPEVHVLVSTKIRGAGYRILQAFETSGRRIIIDRGYVDVEDKNAARCWACDCRWEPALAR